jgi:hypothetical protein
MRFLILVLLAFADAADPTCSRGLISPNNPGTTNHV